MRARLVVACSLILMSSAPAVAEPIAFVPLDGSYGPTFIVSIGSAPGPANRMGLDGSGSASAFGASRITGDAVLVLVDATPCETFTGATFTLKNTAGHAITFSADGKQCYSLGTSTAGAGRVFVNGQGTFRITGGTGAFAGATGGGKMFLTGEVKEVLPGGYRGGYSPLRLDGLVSAPNAP